MSPLHSEISSTPRSGIRRAVVLAAGVGARLKPLTDALPKCMVTVGGEPLLQRTLRELATQGTTEAVLVIGYKGDVVRSAIGSRFAGIDIHYVTASDYETTNNIRSLWHARDYLDQDVLLIEGDVAFDRAVITALLEQPGSSAAVVPYHRALSGTVVRCDREKRVTSFVLGADQDRQFHFADSLKTVNIYVLREKLLRETLVPRLCLAIEAGHVDRYYETILRDCVADGSLTDLAAVDVSATRWYEIDDRRDLEAARFLFLDRSAQFDRIQKLHGAYWRYGFTDHSYLYNMHFPPPEMLEGFRADLRDLVTNYPVAQNELARLVSDWTGADPRSSRGGQRRCGADQDPRRTVRTASDDPDAVVQRVRGGGRCHGLNRFPLEQETFELDVDAFAESAIRWRSDTAVVVTPNNPTAVSVSREDILHLARLLEPHDCRLVVDESFMEFSRAGGSGSVEGDVAAYPNLVVIKSMSKVFGIAGLRLGYLLSADRAFVTSVRQSLPIWNVNALAEEFLRVVGRYREEFAESCELTRTTCRELYTDLSALPGLDCVEPDANFVFGRMTDPTATASDFARRLYVEHNILIKDCSGKSMPDANRYLRIASRTPAENRVLVEALAALL